MYKINPEKCTGCQKCIEVCPCGAIREDENDSTKCIIDVEICADCGACEMECPFEAIEEIDE